MVVFRRFVSLRDTLGKQGKHLSSSLAYARVCVYVARYKLLPLLPWVAVMPADPFYASAAWRALRRSVLATHPSCAVPGCTRTASHVDHVLSRRARPDLALDRRNLQALCHGCHSAKTVRRDGGMGRAPSAARIAAKGCDAFGNPVDPGHAWNAGARKPVHGAEASAARVGAAGSLDGASGHGGRRGARVRDHPGG